MPTKNPEQSNLPFASLETPTAPADRSPAAGAGGFTPGSMPGYGSERGPAPAPGKDDPKDNPDESPALKAWRAKYAILSDIPINRTLDLLGAAGNQDRSKNKYKIAGVGNIIIKDQTWLNGNQQVSGYGSVSLVQHAMDFEKSTLAMNWLAEQCPEVLEGDWLDRVPKESRPESGYEIKSFRPPEPDDCFPAVRSYLVHQRGLPPSLIDREGESGRLYATRLYDEKSHHFYGEPRAVFIGPSSAEIRSVEPDGFKGSSPGSDSDNSGYQVPFLNPAQHEKVVGLTEAAVDACAYHALNPNRWCMSTNGAGRFGLQYRITLECSRNGFSTDHAYDADFAGDLAAQRIVNALFLRDRLAQEWNTTPEAIDVLLLKNRILSVPADSPHELFLLAPDQTDYPVFTHRVEKGEDGKVATVAEDTGTRAPATISVKIPKTFGTLKRGRLSFTVTPSEIKSVLDAYNVRRSRPVGGKDWDEIWKRKGPEAVAAYEALYAAATASSVPLAPASASTDAAGSSSKPSASAPAESAESNASDTGVRPVAAPQQHISRFARTGPR